MRLLYHNQTVWCTICGSDVASKSIMYKADSFHSAASNNMPDMWLIKTNGTSISVPILSAVDIYVHTYTLCMYARWEHVIDPM